MAAFRVVVAQLAAGQDVGFEPGRHVIMGRGRDQSHAGRGGEEASDGSRHAAGGGPIQHARELIGDDDDLRLCRNGAGPGQGDCELETGALAVGEFVGTPREEHRVGEPGTRQRGDGDAGRAGDEIDDRAIRRA